MNTPFIFNHHDHVGFLRCQTGHSKFKHFDFTLLPRDDDPYGIYCNNGFTVKHAVLNLDLCSRFAKKYQVN